MVREPVSGRQTLYPSVRPSGSLGRAQPRSFSEITVSSHMAVQSRAPLRASPSRRLFSFWAGRAPLLPPPRPTPCAQSPPPPLIKGPVISLTHWVWTAAGRSEGGGGRLWLGCPGGGRGLGCAKPASWHTQPPGCRSRPTPPSQRGQGQPSAPSPARGRQPPAGSSQHPRGSHSSCHPHSHPPQHPRYQPTGPHRRHPGLQPRPARWCHREPPRAAFPGPQPRPHAAS